MLLLSLCAVTISLLPSAFQEISPGLYEELSLSEDAKLYIKQHNLMEDGKISYPEYNAISKYVYEVSKEKFKKAL